jgi:DNA-binding Xre family transcriptional regulator
MGISWRLKTYLATKHRIYTATELQKKIIKNTGIIISLQNICNYLQGKPKTLPLKTIEIICTTFDCDLSDFCKVTPNKKEVIKRKKLSYKNTPLSKRGINNFPNPENYDEQ